MELTTNTVRIGSTSNIGLNAGDTATRIFDIVVVGKTGAATRLSLYDFSSANDARERLTVYAPSETAANAAASSTNYISFTEGIVFPDGCFVETGGNFGYASITFGTQIL